VTISQFKIIEFSIKKVVCCDNDCSVKTTTNLSHINFTKKILLIILLLLPPPQQSFPLVSSNIPYNFFLTKLYIKFHGKTKNIEIKKKNNARAFGNIMKKNVRSINLSRQQKQHGITREI